MFLLVVAFVTGCDGTQPDADAVETVFGSAGRGDGAFNYPRGIAISPVDGCVFVVDKSVPARIQRFSADGKFEHSWRTPDAKNGKPTGLYVDHENRVWVPDTHYARVIRYDRDGREQFRFGSRGEGPGQFIFPTAILVDRKGFIYVGEYGGNDRISKFSPEGVYLSSFADEASGEGWVDRPTEILMDDSGDLWVSDACNHRICHYDADGKFISAFGVGGDEPGTYGFPYGMAFEKNGNLLVADRGNNRIIRLNPQGEVLGTWGSQGRARGQLLQPWGVAVGPNGRIYCLDSWNYRVQVIDW
jgi:DNA-binding beta-propeller fold protein YncE